MDAAFYLTMGYDALGMIVLRQIWEGDDNRVTARSEMLLAHDPGLNRVTVERIDPTRRGGVRLKTINDTRVPF